ncbi:MAG: hypothetical protein PHQ98_01655 [Candidatus ainarchaeum sp.]|nr:hypothetical protein [Candidatus ainarchaeum sp.]
MGLKENILIISIIFCFLTIPVFSQAISNYQNTFWQGSINVIFDKDNFSENENITGKIILSNSEDYPLLNGTIVLNISQGTFSYPSQLSDSDNILDYSKINNIYVSANSIKEINFNLPNKSSGKYRLDIYAWVMKSNLIGSDSIYVSPVSKEFTVNNSPIDYSQVKILRTKTNFNNVVGPVGFATKTNEKYFGKIFIQNDSNLKLNDLTLEIQICDWSVAFCDSNNLFSKSITNIGLNSNEAKSIDVNLISPLLPSAYEIKMILKDSKKIYSIYSSRMIVIGPTAKIRKIYIDGIGTNNYSLNTIYAGSPDHFTYPIFENFTIETEVYSSSSSKKYAEQISSIKTNELFSYKLNIDEKQFDKICQRIKQDNVVYDEECFSVPLNDLENEYSLRYPKVVDVNYIYTESSNNLQINLSKEININGKITIFDDSDFVIEEMIIDSKNFSKSYTVKKSNLTLVIDDYDAKKQLIYTIEAAKENNLVNEIDVNKIENLTYCKGQICGENTVCSKDTIDSIEGKCCTSECISVIEGNTLDLITIPLILFVAIIILIISILIFVSILKRRE